MTRKSSLFLRHFGSRSVRAALVGVIGIALVLPAAAQRFEERFPGEQRRRPPAPIPQQQERPSGFQFPFFGGFSPSRPSFFDPAPQQKQAPAADFSRAPAPTHKGDTQPTSTIVVLGDSMADWLAYGLEDILADMPEVGVVRKHKTHSGLVRYDTKAEPPDWAVAARDILSAEKPTAIVMMVGSNDRMPLRDAPEKPEKPATSDTPSIVAPEKRAAAGTSHEFQSEKWTELYTKRIDDTMTAMKARGAPVFWVGLPSQRGPRATADALFLNDLYRGRAEKAGIVYVDIWDGFVNEAGKFTIFGPDFEGQNRRLRAGDGVHFTKAGAQKLAHYVDREIKRAIQNRLLPVALPAQDEPSAPTVARPGGPAPRPIAGPVVPLSAPPPSGEELLGGSSSRAPTADPLVTRVLVKGDAAPISAGRADDYSWPPGSALAAAPAAAPAPAEITSTVDPAPVNPPVTIVRRPAATTETPAARTTTAPTLGPAPAPGLNPSAVKPPARALIRRAPEADAHPDSVRPIAPTAPTAPAGSRPAIRRAPPADTGDAPRPPAPVGRAAFTPFGATR